MDHLETFKLKSEIQYSVKLQSSVSIDLPKRKDHNHKYRLTYYIRSFSSLITIHTPPYRVEVQPSFRWFEMGNYC